MKQKQTQKVVINIGETKPKRRAPRRKAPARGTRPKPGAPGGGVGGGGAPPVGGVSMPSDFFPRGPPTVILPNRAGPIAEPQSQLQQLIRPIEQSLLRLEMRQPPQLPAPQYIAEGKEEERPTMKSIRDYMAQYLESIPFAPEPQFASTASYSEASASSAAYPMLEVREQGTQTGKMTAETGTQYVVDQPDEPLVKPAGVDPLIDSVRPVESKPRKVVIEEDVEDEKLPSAITEYTAKEIQDMRDRGQITEEFLRQYQVSRVDRRNMNLLKVARKLGMAMTNLDKSSTKQALIDRILAFVRR